MAYPQGLIDSLQQALDKVVPDNVAVVMVENDTFGTAEIPVNEPTK